MTRPIAYIVKTAKPIAPFGDDVSEVLINHKSLRDQQRDALTGSGFEIRYVSRQDEIPDEEYPCLVLTDDLYFTAASVRSFLKISEGTSSSTQCAISKDTAFCRLFAPFKDSDSPYRVDFPMYHLKQPRSADLQPVVIDVCEHKLPFYIPAHMRGSAETALPVTSRPIVQISYAVDILLANIACLHVRFAQALDSLAQRMLLLMRARSTQPARVLARLNRVGPGCDIHPTAYLEGAEIGANVKIGANAVIRMSSIGDGCDIGDGSVVKHSIVGEGSVLFDDLTLGFAVCYPETFLIHGPYHLSVFGRASAMFATILHDFRLDGNPIRLEIDGHLLPFPFPFVGSFIGHRTRVAGGSVISPGRSIPNDLLIFPSPGEVLSRIPADVPRGVPLFIQNGELRELAYQADADRAVGLEDFKQAAWRASR
jgi:carbonic anhydrase/acetyltransferase-like protein (isoleucine patch superfamily)